MTRSMCMVVKRERLVLSSNALRVAGVAKSPHGDVAAVALVRGPAIVNRHDLVFAGTPTEPAIAAAHAALLAAGILVR